MLRAAFLLTCFAWTGTALAADGALSLPGKATVGPESRDVTLAFGCTTTRSRREIGSLNATLNIPNFSPLEKRFDFGAFEGPEATDKPLTEITAAGTATQTERLSAGGHISVDSTTFVLGVGAALSGAARELAKVRSVLAAASAGPGTLRWRQESPRKGDGPFLVTVPISAAAADRLKALIAPCLKAK